MKRSEINAALKWAEDMLAKNNIRLPEYAYWGIDEWKKHRDEIGEIRKVMLGWDITDFGSGDFDHLGAVLYTVRNGDMSDPENSVPYCEKYIIMKEGQRLPNHYHVFKTEDIITRASGTLALKIWNTDTTGNMLDTDVRINVDGIWKTFRCGEVIEVTCGNSVRLTPHVTHIFGPKAGAGDLIVGEVSRVNDDCTDNYFLEPTSRFADIEEDEAPLHPLCNEYGRLLFE